MSDWISLAAGQSYPAGTLYVVATPIGNVADLSLRALHVLGLADAIACEDTRNTGQLLSRVGLQRPLVAVHEHNEREAAGRIVQRLAAGERIAYVSDAGTPGISDPGARLVEAARVAGLPVVPLPGPSAAVPRCRSRARCSTPALAALLSSASSRTSPRRAARPLPHWLCSTMRGSCTRRRIASPRRWPRSRPGCRLRARLLVGAS